MAGGGTTGRSNLHTSPSNSYNNNGSFPLTALYAPVGIDTHSTLLSFPDTLFPY